MKAIPILVSAALAASAASADVGLRHYKSADWGFGLDIPADWHGYPPDRRSPAEVVRFYPDTPGISLLIVFRSAHDPKKTINEVLDGAERNLGKQGYAHFARGEARIGDKAVITLDFDRAQSLGTWNCREYFIFNDAADYVLGFGAANRDGMFPLYERIAKSFVLKD